LRIRYARCVAANGRIDKARAELEKIKDHGDISYAVKQRIKKELKLLDQEFSEGAR
jgi:hypothetical protein